MAYKYEESQIIQEYEEEMTSRIQRMHPNWDAKKIKKFVNKKILEQVQNPMVLMDNNYIGEQKSASLLSVLDWVMMRKPIIAGNGTFYKTQDEAINPVANMLDGILTRRKSFKNSMFSIKDTNSDEYFDLDLKQGNEKVNANSWYGASGSPWSAFYSKWSGASTTGSAQSVISTTYTTFESFLGDNYIFLDLDEFMYWVKEALKDDISLDDFVQRKSVEDVYQRYKDKFYKKKNDYDSLLYQYLSGFSKKELTRIYYKNNLKDFILDHEEIRQLYEAVIRAIPEMKTVDVKNPNWRDELSEYELQESYNVETAEEWNKHVFTETFCDPNKLPSTVADMVKQFSGYAVKYVYCQYLSFDRIHRLKNFYRKVVTVIDTDSNILALDSWVDFTKEYVMKSDYGRNNISNTFIIVNTLTFMITEVVTDILLYYGSHSNIPERYRSKFNMKNEFFFTKLVIAYVKKRYLSSIKLREGNLLSTEKTDIKGFDFRKSTTSEESSNRFISLVEKYLLCADTIDVKGLEDALFAFQEEVQQSIQNGETKYLPNCSVKEMQAYKEPASEQSVRGYLAWNMLNPDDLIEPPIKASILKLTLFDEEDCEPLRYTHPDVHRTIIDKIFHDRTGVFVSASKNGKKKSRGLQVLVIPNHAKIPEWCIPYIDINNMVNSTMAPFKSVMDLLHVQYASEGKTINGISRKSDGLTNIIKF